MYCNYYPLLISSFINLYPGLLTVVVAQRFHTDIKTRLLCTTVIMIYSRTFWVTTVYDFYCAVYQISRPSQQTLLNSQIHFKSKFNCVKLGQNQIESNVKYTASAVLKVRYWTSSTVPVQNSELDFIQNLELHCAYLVTVTNTYLLTYRCIHTCTYIPTPIVTYVLTPNNTSSDGRYSPFIQSQSPPYILSQGYTLTVDSRHTTRGQTVAFCLC